MKYDRKIKEAIGQMKGKLESPCPDEEVLAAFIEKKLPKPEYAEVGTHMVACDQCRDMVTAAWGEVPRRLRVPVEVMQRAFAVLPAKESKWEIVVNFTADFIEVVRNSGGRTQYFSPAHATSRSGRAAQANLVACSDNISGIDTELEIERVEEGTGELKVTMKEGGGVPSPSIRVTLKQDNKELASYMAPQGSACFERVSVGDYNIVLSRKGIYLGEIALEMKGE